MAERAELACTPRAERPDEPAGPAAATAQPVRGDWMREARGADRPARDEGRRDREFSDFVRGRSTTLLRLAVLLAGGDRPAGEDLLQDVLARMYRHWRRIDGSPEAYARRALVNGATNRWRGRRRRPETRLPDSWDVATAAPADTVELRDALVRALLGLPARQRAALVLRYYADLSEEDTAAAMNCSAGAVKYHASRGLARLRASVGDHGLDPRSPGGIE